MTQKSFTIGALAKKAEVNVETIRFYQRREPARGTREATQEHPTLQRTRRTAGAVH